MSGTSAMDIVLDRRPRRFQIQNTIWRFTRSAEPCYSAGMLYVGETFESKRPRLVGSPARTRPILFPAPTHTRPAWPAPESRSLAGPTARLGSSLQPTAAL